MPCTNTLPKRLFHHPLDVRPDWIEAFPNQHSGCRPSAIFGNAHMQHAWTLQYAQFWFVDPAACSHECRLSSAKNPCTDLLKPSGLSPKLYCTKMEYPVFLPYKGTPSFLEVLPIFRSNTYPLHIWTFLALARAPLRVQVPALHADIHTVHILLLRTHCFCAQIHGSHGQRDRSLCHASMSQHPNQVNTAPQRDPGRNRLRVDIIMNMSCCPEVPFHLDMVSENPLVSERCLCMQHPHPCYVSLRPLTFQSSASTGVCRPGIWICLWI